MSTAAELLQRHRPFLKYDSQEAYFADSAAEWTDNPGNRLVAADGTVLATAGDGLSLAFLGGHYPDGRAAGKDDVIGDPARNYAQQARALHARPAYANRIYGRVARDSRGEDWLQYWFFYFFNDYNLIGPLIHAGLHEGDWESIQIHLAGEAPDRAVYAQHAGGEGRDWRQVDVLAGTQRPIVYVARGSHASYFEPGTQWTGHWFDQADGKRRSPDATLEVIDESLPAFRWLRWPGRWGDTRSAGGPFDSDSPRGPARHAQWGDPLALDGAARGVAPAGLAAEAPPVAPPPPYAEASWHDGGIRVSYRVADPQPGGARVIGLVVTLNSPDDPEPPTTEAFPIESDEGHLDLPGHADPARRYDLHVSAATADALASASVRVDLEPAEGPP